eukprot:2775035-Prymnesium_polylepis.1
MAHGSRSPGWNCIRCTRRSSRAAAPLPTTTVHQPSRMGATLPVQSGPLLHNPACRAPGAAFPWPEELSKMKRPLQRTAGSCFSASGSWTRACGPPSPAVSEMGTCSETATVRAGAT